MREDDLDLLRAFSVHRVRYLLVGAHAVSFYSEPRTTGDLDLFIEPTAENARRVHAALHDFGAPLDDLSEQDLATPGVVYQMGVAPRRIDLINELSGVTFAECWEGHATVTLGGVAVPVISRAALLRNKAASGRSKDREDLDLLAKHAKQDGSS
jgi:predicted nucleotidyltransferase